MMEDFWPLLGKLPWIVVFIFFFVRLMGNKEMKQSTPIEFAYLVLLVSIAWDMLLADQFKVYHIFLAMSLLTILILFLDWLTYKFPFMERLLIGQRKTIIRNGQLNETVLRKERISRSELDSKLRAKEIFDYKNIKVAYIELDGEITVKVKED